MKHYSCLANFDGLADVCNNRNDRNELPIPTEGNLVALVVSTTINDYHWYRQDSTGMFSHKPGKNPVTNKDNNGRPIRDPRKCARDPYNHFVGFMITNPTKVNV